MGFKTGHPYLDLALYGYSAYQSYKNMRSRDVETDTVDQDTGLRRFVARKVVGGRKRFNINKLLKSTVEHTEQCLGLRDCGAAIGDFHFKHPVSEFNPGVGGFYPICQQTDMNWTPMHIYDLNLYVGNLSDAKGNYPLRATSQNDDVNARAWIWLNNNKWTPLRNGDTATDEPRYYINEPRTSVQSSTPQSNKIYRKGIAIDFMAYGTNRMATEFEFRVIKIMDKDMCPDYPMSLTDTDGESALKDFQQNWQNMIRAWTINPMLRGVEPGPKPAKPWFRTIASKKIRIGENSNLDSGVPTAQGKIYIHINEAQKYGGWDDTGFTVEAGDAAYDDVPNVDDEAGNPNFLYKPYYTSRYYLLVRALSPNNIAANTWNATSSPNNCIKGFEPTNNNAGPLGLGSLPTFGGVLDYCPSYDIAIRTTFMTVNAI